MVHAINATRYLLTGDTAVCAGHDYQNIAPPPPPSPVGCAAATARTMLSPTTTAVYSSPSRGVQRYYYWAQPKLRPCWPKPAAATRKRFAAIGHIYLSAVPYYKVNMYTNITIK